MKFQTLQIPGLIKTSCLIFFLILGLSACKQPPKKIEEIDALIARLSEVRREADEVEQLTVLSDSALTMAKALNYTQGLGNIYKELATFYKNKASDQQDYQRSDSLFQLALKFRQKNGDPNKVAEVFHNWASLKLKTGEYEQSIEYCLNAQEIWEKLNLPERFAASLNSTGNAFRELGMDSMANAYYQTSVDVLTPLDDSPPKKQYLADAQTNIVKSKLIANQCQEALDIAQYLRKEFIELNDLNGQLMIEDRLGQIYLCLDSFRLAEEKFQSYLQQSLEKDYVEKTFYAYLHLGDLKQKAEQPETALNYYLKADSTLSLLGNNPDLKIALLRDGLIPVSLKLGNLDNYHALLDSVNTLLPKQNLEPKREKGIIYILSSLEERKELEKSAKLRLWWLTYALIALLISILILAFLIYRFRQKAHKAELERIREENNLKILDAIEQARERAVTIEKQRFKVILHDDIKNELIKNALSLENFLKDPEKTNSPEAVTQAIEEEIERCDQIGRHAKALIEGLDQLIGGSVTLIDAIKIFCDLISNNTDLQVIHLNMETINNLPPAFVEDCGLDIRKMVEEGILNVMEHAKATQCKVEVKTKGDFFRLKIEDDGIGFNPEKYTQGIGLKNIKQRAEKCGGTLSIQSATNKGTVIEVVIPVKNIPNTRYTIT